MFKTVASIEEKIIEASDRFCKAHVKYEEAHAEYKESRAKYEEAQAELLKEVHREYDTVMLSIGKAADEVEERPDWTMEFLMSEISKTSEWDMDKIRARVRGLGFSDFVADHVYRWYAWTYRLHDALFVSPYVHLPGNVEPPEEPTLAEWMHQRFKKDFVKETSEQSAAVPKPEMKFPEVAIPEQNTVWPKIAELNAQMSESKTAQSQRMSEAQRKYEEAYTGLLKDAQREYDMVMFYMEAVAEEVEVQDWTLESLMSEIYKMPPKDMDKIPKRVRDLGFSNFAADIIYRWYLWTYKLYEEIALSPFLYRVRGIPRPEQPTLEEWMHQRFKKDFSWMHEPAPTAELTSLKELNLSTVPASVSDIVSLTNLTNLH